MSPYTVYMHLGEFSPLLHFMSIYHTIDPWIGWVRLLLINLRNELAICYQQPKLFFECFLAITCGEGRPYYVWHGKNISYQRGIGVCKTSEYKWGMKLCQELLNMLLIICVLLLFILKIFPSFWLVKTTRIIHHNQPMLIENFVILNRWRHKCSRAAVYWTTDVKMTSKVQSAADYWTIDVKDLTKTEMAVSKFTSLSEENEWIIKQLLNSAFVGYEEFCRSRRVLNEWNFI